MSYPSELSGRPVEIRRLTGSDVLGPGGRPRTQTQASMRTGRRGSLVELFVGGGGARRGGQVQAAATEKGPPPRPAHANAPIAHMPGQRAPAIRCPIRVPGRRGLDSARCSRTPAPPRRAHRVGFRGTCCIRRGTAAAAAGCVPAPAAAAGPVDRSNPHVQCIDFI
jgi:hypothetical protein